MEDGDTHFSLGARGTLLEFPFIAEVKNKNGQLEYSGTVCLEKAKISRLIPGNDKSGSLLTDYLDKAIGDISAEVSFSCTNQEYSFEINTPVLLVKALRNNNSFGILVTFDAQKTITDGNWGFIYTTVSPICNKLSISKLFLFLKQGTGVSFTDLTVKSGIQFLHGVADYACIIYGDVNFTSNPNVGNALLALFGTAKLELFLGIDPAKKKYSCSLAIPASEARSTPKYLTNRSLYIDAAINGKELSLALKGKFTFAFDFKSLADSTATSSAPTEITFTVDCGFSTSAFILSAAMTTKERIPILPGFSIGDTALLIGYEAKLIFGILTTLYIKDLPLFAAIILNYTGTLNISLISAAVENLSLSVLLKNITGLNLPGADVLDIICIDSFDLKTAQPFEQQWLVSNNIAAVVKHFNDQIQEASFHLIDGKVQLKNIENGYALIDNNRMCHYFIDTTGNLSLQAQFYYSNNSNDIQFGAYTISPGIFICGKVKLFKIIEFAVLFSFRQEEGVTASVMIKPINLGFLRISSSGASADLLPIPEDSLLKQLIPSVSVAEGVVFFLSANKKDISFYFDGKIEILNFYTITARLMYTNCNISIYAAFLLGDHELEASLKLEAAYNDFAEARFFFIIVLDMHKLEDKMKAELKTVTDNINSAIVALREKVQDTISTIKQAQITVNRLYVEISKYNVKIEDCKKAINSAVGFERIFVAIAKGVEIAVYEIAIAGIYIAIYAATAALEIAKLALDFIEKLGADVLILINAVITTASSLLFIRKIELKVIINHTKVEISAAFSFVALGIEYNSDHKENPISAVSLSDPPQWLAEKFNDKMKNDINDLKAGKINRSGQKIDSGKIPTFKENRKNITQALNEIEKARTTILDMQNDYKETAGEEFSRFNMLNRSLSDTLAELNNSLNTTGKAIDMQSLTTFVNGLTDLSVNDQKKIKNVTEKYNAIYELHELVQSVLASTENVKADIDSCKEPKRSATKPGTQSTRGATGSQGEMLSYLDRLELKICNIYNSRKDTGYINLYLEDKIILCLDGARSHFGGKPSKEIEQLRRNRLRKYKYVQRM